MTILDIINRLSPAQSVEHISPLPWDNLEFSEQMLKEHLSQKHDMASRNLELVKKQVDWIHSSILQERSSKILDLCCGPGLYTNMLAKLGHRCRGIDFSPAAIEYAHITKIELMLDCEYILSDIRNADFGKEMDLCLYLFGDFNSKTKTEISRILKRINTCLTENGYLLLELFNYDTIEEIGNKPSTWATDEDGGFSSKPHLVLKDYEWVHGQNLAVSRYHVIHPYNQKVEVYAERFQAYTYPEYIELFERNGFTVHSKFQSLANERDSTGLNLFGLLLKKTA